MTEPNDRELEQYLKGDSPLSRRYREASGETAPPELDEAILARARAEARRKPPGLNRVLAPVALAASVVLGVNLAWNLKQAEPLPPMPAEAPLPVAMSEDKAVREEPAAPSAGTPPVEAKRRARAVLEAPRELPGLPNEPDEWTYAEGPAHEQPEDAGRVTEQLKAEERAALAKRIESQQRASKMKDEAGVAAPVVDSAPVAAASAPAAGGVAPAAVRADVAPLSEAQKVDRLIGYVAALQDAVFIRNATEHAPAEAAKHLQLKREKAGSRVKTAADFIRLCASHSSMSGEAYLIRFVDGRTRTAEDVLREELARIEASAQ